MIPAQDGPLSGFHLCSMAHIYPEHRGTNDAIREGRKPGARLAAGIGIRKDGRRVCASPA
jgi:hypothetical protein